MSVSKIEIYNKYNVVHDGEKVDVANWAKKFGMEVNVEDEESKQRLYLGNTVVVAVSPGFGSGWSSWNYFTAVDPVMNLMLLTLKDMIDHDIVIEEEDVLELYGALRQDFPRYKEYLAAAYSVEKIEIEYVDKDIRFKVTEYDGYESIEYEHESEWL